jgi:pimeloyl-ACP methyl ester carboxylesterase
LSSGPDGDGLVPAAHAESYAAEIPGAKLETLPGAHPLSVERPAEVAELIARFAESL